MTVKEAAKALECSPSLVYALIQEKRLKCERRGRRGRRGKIVIRDEYIQAFIEESRAELEEN